ncbi:uncharacterized protein EV154DRAFT_588843 [Mucor mucedo]|uniref:uncharacterized protein n=1 Tax=Mucor mucedo TaxID=29922 RepID=UPI00221EF3E7|nr:uncharacterized protein EV154DRAFT_588843 [Mucor mucedo]KAI7891141.1 hypothetical protein EV154DRAFT_588843 [Mucor mucedo]
MVNLEAVKKIVATGRAKQQPMSFKDLLYQYRLPRAGEVFRGTLILLRERDLLDKNASLSKVCPSGTVHDPAVRPGSCAEYLVSQQPDFLAQKNMLETVMFEAGHLFTLYPKYHCETNWIERHWGAAKRYSRMMSDYSFYTLTSRIHEFLDNDEVVHGPKINRRYYNRAYRCIDAYSKCKDQESSYWIFKQQGKVNHEQEVMFEKHEFNVGNTPSTSMSNSAMTTRSPMLPMPHANRMPVLSDDNDAMDICQEQSTKRAIPMPESPIAKRQKATMRTPPVGTVFGKAL